MRHGSLFSGIGGFDLAAQWMGWENVFQVEWDKWCQKILAKNFPDTLRFGDIVEFNKMLQNGEIITNTTGDGFSKRTTIGKKIPKEIRGDEFNIRNITQGKDKRINLGQIDILTGGFPCQPFSHAGKRKGVDDSRYLWPSMLTTIRILKPSFVVGENVAGLVSMGNGKTLDGILSDLANEGYTTEQFIIPACAIGAWHRRDRIWIVAYSDGCRRDTQSLSGSKRVGRENNINIKQSGKDVPDTSDSRLQGLQEIGNNGNNGTQSNDKFTKGCNREWEMRDFKSELGRMVNGLPYWLHEPNGVPRVAAGIKNRVDRLKGLGNAIVPQVAFELFKVIQKYYEMS